eukprot:117941-Hanusia_phi.AAC.1
MAKTKDGGNSREHTITEIDKQREGSGLEGAGREGRGVQEMDEERGERRGEERRGEEGMEGEDVRMCVCV